VRKLLRFLRLIYVPTGAHRKDKPRDAPRSLSRCVPATSRALLCSAALHLGHQQQPVLILHPHEGGNAEAVSACPPAGTVFQKDETVLKLAGKNTATLLHLA